MDTPQLGGLEETPRDLAHEPVSVLNSECKAVWEPSHDAGEAHFLRELQHIAKLVREQRVRWQVHYLPGGGADEDAGAGARACQIHFIL